MALKLKVTQVRSGIGQSARQKATLAGLGLAKMHKSVILKDSVPLRGMIRKVSHLVKVEPVE